MNIIINLLKIVLLILIFVTLYFLFETAKDKKIDRKVSSAITDGVEILNKKYEERLKNLQYSQYYISKENKRIKYISNLDLLVEKSNVRNRFNVSAEIIIIISVINSLAIFIVSYRFLFNIYVSVILAVATYLIPQMLLNIKVNKNAEKVDKELMNYISNLENFCNINDDIVYAIAKSIDFAPEPLKSFSSNFIVEVKHGINPIEALDNYGKKVDNRKFKFLIKVLKLCYKYDGSYVSVLSKEKELIKKYTIEKYRRKEKAKENRTVIYFLMLISLIVFYGLQKINQDFFNNLRTNLSGQLLVAYNICIYIYCIYKTITIEKFEF